MVTDLKKIDIFSTLSDEELQSLSEITTIRTLEKDAIVFYEGDDADALYALIEGSLKLYKIGIKSNEVILHHFNAPTLVAEMATLENIKFPATAQATMQNTKIAVINKENFLSLLHQNSDVSLHIIKSLTKKIKHLEVAINRNLIFDATAKVCSLLKENPKVFQNQKHTQIASFLNMAPETLSRMVTKLKKIQILDDEYNLLDSSKLDMFLEF
jgi:CRP/FNR family transcriptional regulator